MKRLHGLSFSLSHDITKQDCLHRVPVGKYKAFIYLTSENVYSKYYLERCDYLDLPCLDVYAVQAETKGGINCGFVFDVPSKTPIYGSTYLIGSTTNFNPSFKDMKEANSYVSLKQKIKSCNLYVLKGVASLVTIASDVSDMKEVIDI